MNATSKAVRSTLTLSLTLMTVMSTWGQVTKSRADDRSEGAGKSPVMSAARATSHNAPGDFDGDGKTDFSIVRPSGGGGSGTLTWWIRTNGTNNISATPFGLNSDNIIPADFDGDGHDDITIYRSTGGGQPGFWVLYSKTGTAGFSPFGQNGDDPFVVADYTNDGIDDLAIYRPDPVQGFFWFWPSSGPYVGQYAGVPWGNDRGTAIEQRDTALFGDYNGDGFADFTIYRLEGTRFRVWTLFGSADLLGQTWTTEQFGGGNDFFVPGDYNGDGATDLAVTRFVGAAIRWIYKESGTGVVRQINWGLSSSDIEAHGDYDGDGTTDLAIWRSPGANPAPLDGYFIIRLSGSPGGVRYEPWGGLLGDLPTIWELK